MTTTAIPILLGEDQALSLIESIIKQSQAEGVFVRIEANESSLSRFSENQISQNISKNNAKITITSYLGKRSASASTNELEPEAIKAIRERSETLARFAPEDPEWVSLLEPQTYAVRKPAFDLETAQISPLAKGEIIQRVCALGTYASAPDAQVNASGTLSTDAYTEAIGNSLGLSAYHQTTKADFSLSVRVDNGSSWDNQTAWAISQLPIEEMTIAVIEKALASRNPRAIKPGIYPVIFDAAAMSSLLPWVIWNMDARAADEGRSFMSRIDTEGKAIGNLVGEPIFSPLVQVQRDPAHPLLQMGTFFADGLSNDYLEIIKDGKPQTLSYSRYWAQQQGKQATGLMSPMVMTGSEQSLIDLIAETEKAILVSRAWYVRYVNPRTLEVTGMTRDGTFWVENGQIAYPIKNLRFNHCLPEMLRDVDALTNVARVGNSVVPGVRVRAFNFSSITDSI